MSLLALVGGRGMLAQKIRQNLPPYYKIVELNRPDFDLTRRDVVLQALRELKPEVIVNCAAYTRVDDCEFNRDLANQVNGEGPGYLAEAARELGAILVHISSDYVFDGNGSRPYVEEDLPNPQSAYGQSKLLGEQAILESGLGKYFIIRTSWLYGPGGNNFVETITRLATEREELRIVGDQVGSPTYTGDLAVAIFELLKTVGYGVYHFSNSGSCSWYEFAKEIVYSLKIKSQETKVERVLPITTEEYPLPAKRPTFSVLSKEKYRKITGAEVPGWQDALNRYMAERISG